MPDRGDVIYRYDGSFEGLMCCVFESYDKKEMPHSILCEEYQLSLFPIKDIPTDVKRAKRVMDSIPQRMAKDTFDFIWRAFLSCLPEKEKYILLFMRMGYRHGAKVMKMMTHDVVHTLAKAVRHLGNETHLLSGFIRFSDYSGVLAAEITPKNFVLPILAPHFMNRYPEERMLIHDKTHEKVWMYERGQTQICDAEGFVLPEPGQEELEFRKLWRLFYDTIAIEGRYNPKCRMTHMPKRYWENMTEFADEGSRKQPENPKYIRSKELQEIPVKTVR